MEEEKRDIYGTIQEENEETVSEETTEDGSEISTPRFQVWETDDQEGTWNHRPDEIQGIQESDQQSQGD